MTTPSNTWEEYIGQTCSIVFNLPPTNWPIAGYPARATLDAVDMPLLCFSGLWVNARDIKTISLF